MAKIKAHNFHLLTYMCLVQCVTQIYNTGSGKTCIIHQLLYKKFAVDTLPTFSSSNQYRMQIKWKNIPFQNKQKQGNFHQSKSEIATCINQPNKMKEQATTDVIEYVKFNIWDFGGNQLHNKVRIASFKKESWNKVCLIVFDISDEKSFNKVQSFVNQWKNYVEKQNSHSIILVGNKTDLQKQNKRKVTYQQGLELAKKHKIIYLQSTAKQDVKFIFQSAYYLKISTTKKFMNKVDKLENYIGYNQYNIKDYQDKKYLKMQERIKVLQSWQMKAIPLIFSIEHFFINQDKQFAHFLEKHLKNYQNFLYKFQDLRQFGNELTNLQFIKSMIGQTRTFSKIDEQQIISNELMNQNQKLNQQIQMIQFLINQLKEKIDSTYKDLATKIDIQKSQMNIQLKIFTEKFFKIRNIYNQSSLSQFVVALNTKIDIRSKIHQYYSRDSMQIINNNNVHTKDLIQKIQQQQKLGQEQLIKLRKVINSQFQIFEKFKSSINKMEGNLIQFYSLIKDQYITFDTSFCYRIQNPDRNEIEQFLLNQFVNKYINANFDQKEQSNSSLIKQHKKSGQTLKSQQKTRVVQSKKQSIKKQFESKFSMHYEQLKGLGGKLKRDIINTHNQRNRINFAKHQISILRYWLNQTKNLAKNKSQIQQNLNFFQRLFRGPK